MSDLIERIRSEAAIADRPGQMGRLEAIADEVEKRLAADRRELWHLESYLAVNGTNQGHHDRRLRLYRHLCATCEHDWNDVGGWAGCPKGTVQCYWCNAVLHPGEKRPVVGSVNSISEDYPRLETRATHPTAPDARHEDEESK